MARPGSRVETKKENRELAKRAREEKPAGCGCPEFQRAVKFPKPRLSDGEHRHSCFQELEGLRSEAWKGTGHSKVQFLCTRDRNTGTLHSATCCFFCLPAIAAYCCLRLRGRSHCRPVFEELFAYV